MLGTLEYAQIAQDLSTGLTAPFEGWRNVGSGSFRTAYLAPDGLIYKVDRNPELSDQYGNRAEWTVWTEWVERGTNGANITLPDMWLHDNGVMAVEYIESDNTSTVYAWNTVERMCKELLGAAYMWVSDVHPGNWRVKDNTVYIIDFGHWSQSPYIDWYEWDRQNRQKNPQDYEEHWDCYEHFGRDSKVKCCDEARPRYFHKDNPYKW